MAEYIVKGESLTVIADKIRVLSGTEDAMGLDDMANEVGNANDDVDTEASLIAQITSALEDKAAGVALPTLSNPATAENLEEGYELIDGDGNIVTGTHVCESGSTKSTVSVTIRNNGNFTIQYYDVSNNLVVTSSGVPMTVEVLNGVVLGRHDGGGIYSLTGSYLSTYLGVDFNCVWIFLEDGGIITTSYNIGGGA